MCLGLLSWCRVASVPPFYHKGLLNLCTELVLFLASLHTSSAALRLVITLNIFGLDSGQPYIRDCVCESLSQLWRYARPVNSHHWLGRETSQTVSKFRCKAGGEESIYCAKGSKNEWESMGSRSQLNLCSEGRIKVLGDQTVVTVSAPGPGLEPITQINEYIGSTNEYLIWFIWLSMYWSIYLSIYLVHIKHI